MLGVAKLLRPDKPTFEKGTTYESGEETEGNAIISFNIRFYIIALIFLLFEVELVFFFPWGTVFGNAELIESTNGQWAWYAIGEMFIFIFILAVGLMYAWREGHLDWAKSEQEKASFEAKVPQKAYEAINKKYQ